MQRRLALAFIGMAVTACATNGSPPPAGPRPEPVSMSTTVTAAELARLAPTQTLMSALKSIRPWFLSVRGTTPMVVIDGSPPLELALLDGLRVTDVFEVRLERANSPGSYTAVTPSGWVIAGDLLVVRTRRATAP